MKFIVKTCKGRENFLPYLKRVLPSTTLYAYDDVGGAMPNFLKALRMAGKEAAVHLEDDIIITKDFEKKCREVVSLHPEAPIQFFSMRKKDLTIGSRWEPGSTYLMNQCHYLPAGMSSSIEAYWYSLSNAWKSEYPTGTDSLVQKYLKDHRLKYWLHVPSLVDHRVGKSVINPRRASTNRQSFTFTDPVE